MRQSVEIPGEEAERLELWLKQLNAGDPPDHTPPWFSGRYRHACPNARIARHTGKPVSTAIDLKERYETPESAGIGSRRDIAIIFREGTCKWCKQTARSEDGLVVFVSHRPPLDGRVAR
jgi:hypothetical protein